MGPSAQDIAAPVLLAVTAYNCLELLIWLTNIFHRRSGLYFYSMLLATLGLTVYTIMTFVQIYVGAQHIASLIVFTFSSAALITGHILTLYSRLDLLLCPQFGSGDRNPRLLRAILIMIIVTTVIFVGPVTAIILYLDITNPRTSGAQPAYWVARATFTAHCVREFLLYGIYIVYALRQIGPIIKSKGATGKKVIVQLVAIQVIAIICDIVYLVVVFAGPQMRVDDLLLSGIQAFLYGIRTKMEFVILNRLVVLLKSPVVSLDSSLAFNTFGDTSSSANSHGFDSCRSGSIPGSLAVEATRPITLNIDLDPHSK
ncbi:hypothetical protein BJX70DRAFT_398897 [Aspergillus crustosus]